jgi:ABC-type dipeptide/oligopeptide/nickel transport system permease component
MSDEAQAPIQSLPTGQISGAALARLRECGFLGLKALRNILAIALQLFAVSVVIFFILRIIPADPLSMLTPGNATHEDADRIRHAYGLDRPIYQQYFMWLGAALQGDLGNSIQAREPVTRLILAALPMTIELAFCGLGLGILLGSLLGLMAFWYRGRPVERIGETIASLAQSIPDFLWGICFVLLFGLWLNVLPFIGPIDPSMIVERRSGFLMIDTLLAGRWDAFGDRLLHLILPATALAMIKVALIMRVLRSSLIEAYQDEYVNAARLRGVGEGAVLFRHALRNAAIPTVALIGVQAAQTFGGTLLIESIYSLPGMGNLLIAAIRTHDLPLIQGISLTYCAIVLLVNALVDLSYLWLNPRLRRQ